MAANSSAPAARPDPRVIADLVARVGERQGLDPAARAQLAEDLRQTDPALWPSLVQVYQAALAYKRQTEERRAATVSGQASAAPAGASPGPLPGPGGSAGANMIPCSQNAAPAQPYPAAETAQPVAMPLARAERPPEAAFSRGAPEAKSLSQNDVSSRSPRDLGSLGIGPKRREQDGASVGRIGNPSYGSVGASQGEQAACNPDPHRAARESGGKSSGDKSEVVAASYAAPAKPAGTGSDSWQERLDGAIKGLESEIRHSPQSADLARQARLRLLQLAAGRREEALRPIQPASPAVQDSWSQMLYGLATWMDTERTPDTGRRAAETRQQLLAAADRLGELAPLLVRNMSLVKEVRSYGDVVPFEKDEFSPGQEVILYAEIENFKSDQTPKGYRTQFRGSYEIFDARGRSVTSQELGNTDEVCRNHRRDFFLNYKFHLPKRIYNGRHTLKLTVEDLHGQKIGDSTLEFTIKAAGD